ncbi:zinc ribbon domain-containing protein [uncultured Clostridium sp.]|uniref:double zinc ribbon domain-containing protein n=1 Tax=uncultured Clostridium sp. TaxID=59620 RepID=UPI0025D14F82|nr:zinc ribbon domain-containing protein [uncultured Clostridium sp.]
MINIRYDLVKKTVNNVFLKYNINSYPINIDKLFEYFKDNIRVVSYTKHMKKFDLTEKEVISYFGSEEGCTIYKEKNNKYLIFYNDLSTTYKTPERIRWTLIHELGHILLNHLKEIKGLKIFRNSISEPQYKSLEAEANRFAALLLANPMLLNIIGINNSSDIGNICNISLEASEYRFSDYLKWSKYKRVSPLEMKIINNFKKTTVCNSCHSKHHSNYNFCPICGDLAIRRGIKNMIYDSLELNDYGKTKICPVCGNEHTNIEGDYCQICGLEIKNTCTQCSAKLDGDARFCPDCGGESTFFVNNILKDWKTVQAQQSYYSYNETPIVEDGDMPF